MTRIKYKRAHLIFQAIFSLLLAAGAAWGFFVIDSIKLRFVLGALALAMPVLGIALGLRASGDLTALAFDRDGITVSTLWRTTSFPWRNVKSVHRETLQRSSGFGFFKQTIAWYLVIVMHEGDGFEKCEKLNEKLLDMPTGSMESLVGRIHAAWEGRAPVPPAGQPAPATDAPPVPARPSFGRKAA